MITRRKFFKYAFYGAACLGFGKGYYNTSNSQIDLNKVPVRLPRLPKSFVGLKIAQLSDLHSSFIVDQDHIAKAAQLVMSQKPDIIVLTGDYLSGKTKFGTGSVGSFSEYYLDECTDALRSLKAPMGIYGVLGNHDFWSGPEAVRSITKKFAKQLGVVWLRNRHIILEKNKDKLALLGVDDYWENSCSLEKSHRGLDKTLTKILLSHNPDINEAIWPITDVDLILSGHTHGGQVVLPVLGMPFLPSPHGQKYRIGLVRDGKRQTYITRGVGHLVAPIRYNCPPEATLITLV